jgi:hypothetical protein
MNNDPYDFSEYGYLPHTSVIGGQKVTTYYRSKKNVSVKALVKKLRRSGFPLNKEQFHVVKEACKKMLK